MLLQKAYAFIVCLDDFFYDFVRHEYICYFCDFLKIVSNLSITDFHTGKSESEAPIQ